jgi:hypothetical protein
MSRASNGDVSSKANKKQKKKKKKCNIEGNPFVVTLESIKKELGIKSVTPEQFWIMQRKVSKFYSFRTAFHYI